MCSPFCGGRWLKTNPCRETCLSWTLFLLLCLYWRWQSPIVYWEKLFLWGTDWVLWSSSAANDFRLMLEILGWEIPFLAVENSLFLACSFVPWVSWTKCLLSLERIVHALHPKKTCLTFGVPWLHESVILFWNSWNAMQLLTTVCN